MNTKEQSNQGNQEKAKVEYAIAEENKPSVLSIDEMEKQIEECQREMEALREIVSNMAGYMKQALNYNCTKPYVTLQDKRDTDRKRLLKGASSSPNV